MKKLMVAVALSCLSASAMATNIPGESAYCIAHCINGFCQPVIANLGEKNFSIGLPLDVVFQHNGGTRLAPATGYSWGQTGTPYGAATNLTGITTDIANSYTISQITMKDSGLYAETGSAQPEPGDTGGGTEILNWCITVNPIAVLNNAIRP